MVDIKCRGVLPACLFPGLQFRSLKPALVDLSGDDRVDGAAFRRATGPYLSALEIREGLAKEDPKNALARFALASSLLKLAIALGQLKEDHRALGYLERAEAVLVNSGGDDRDGQQLADVRYQMAESWLSLGQPAKAAPLARFALERFQALLRGNPASSSLSESVAWAQTALGGALTNSQPTEACSAYRAASRLASDLQAAGRLAPFEKSELLALIEKGLVICGASPTLANASPERK